MLHEANVAFELMSICFVLNIEVWTLRLVWSTLSGIKGVLMWWVGGRLVFSTTNRPFNEGTMGRVILRVYTYQGENHTSQCLCAFFPEYVWSSSLVGRIQNFKSQVTWGQSMQSQSLRRWKLGLTTSHEFYVPRKTWICLHGQHFLKVKLVLIVELSKKLDLTLNTSPTNIFA